MCNLNSLTTRSLDGVLVNIDPWTSSVALHVYRAIPEHGRGEDLRVRLTNRDPTTQNVTVEIRPPTGCRFNPCFLGYDESSHTIFDVLQDGPNGTFRVQINGLEPAAWVLLERDVTVEA